MQVSWPVTQNMVQILRGFQFYFTWVNTFSTASSRFKEKGIFSFFVSNVVCLDCEGKFSRWRSQLGVVRSILHITLMFMI